MIWKCSPVTATPVVIRVAFSLMSWEGLPLGPYGVHSPRLRELCLNLQILSSPLAAHESSHCLVLTKCNLAAATALPTMYANPNIIVNLNTFSMGTFLVIKSDGFLTPYVRQW